MINKLKNIIGNRIVCIVAFGKSVKELENHIEKLKNYDVCWMGCASLYTWKNDKPN